MSDDTTGPDSGSPAVPSGLLDSLACPDCRVNLALVAGTLRCSGCRREYPIAADGTLPILFSRNSDFFGREREFSAWQRVEKKGTRQKGYREARHLPRTSVSNLADAPWERFLLGVGGGRLLNIGSGIRSVTTTICNWINLDIAPHNNVDVVGDAHWLPFTGQSFDAVASRNVFAYLRNPFQAASEIARVLKPGGLMWCNETFALPLAAPPTDYFRYSADGLKSIFHELEPVETGPTEGPCRIIARYAEAASEAMFPGRLGFCARWCIAWALHPPKYLDGWLVRRDPACATAYYIVARKPREE